MGGAWVFPGGAVHDDDGGHAAHRVARDSRRRPASTLEAEPSSCRSRAGSRRRGQGPLRHLVLRRPRARRRRGDAATASECVDARWIRPADALAAGRARRADAGLPHDQAPRAAGRVRVGRPTRSRRARGRTVEPVEPRVRDRRRTTPRCCCPASRATTTSRQPRPGTCRCPCLRPDRPAARARHGVHVDRRLPLQAPRRGGVARRRAAAAGAHLARAVPLALVHARDRRGHGVVGPARGGARRWRRSRSCSR